MHAFLPAGPDVGKQGKREGRDLKVVKNQILKIELNTLLQLIFY